MSCSVCNGIPGCPCCTPEPMMTECPACNGTGKIYYNADGERVSEEEYAKLPADERDVDTCAECDGSGEVEFEYDGYDE